jgi:hypothetical protein
LGTGATAATSASKEQVGIGKGLQQLATRGHLDGPLSVDFDTDIPAGNQSAAGGKNHQYQRKNDCGEHAGAVSDCHIH